MRRTETQKLRISYHRGGQGNPGPAGWTFDKTAVIVWAKLLELTRDGPDGKRRLDEFAHDRQCYMLANILSNALGMAPPYWNRAAEALAK